MSPKTYTMYALGFRNVLESSYTRRLVFYLHSQLSELHEGQAVSSQGRNGRFLLLDCAEGTAVPFA
jgi:hypothetical protein